MAELSLKQHTHPFLVQLTDRHRLLLMSGIRPFSREPGEYLIKEGEPADTLFLIRTGRCVVEATDADGKPIPVQTLGPDCVLGWSWLLPPYRWQFSCRAGEEIEGLAVDSSWFREKCEEDFVLGNHVYRNLIEIMAQRIAGLLRQRIHSASEPPQEPSYQECETGCSSP